MATEDNAKLLILNKEAQVAALQELGLPAEDDTPLSTLADYTKWAGGLLDITFACAPSDGSGTGIESLSYFSPEEFNSLPAIESDKQTIIGVRIRVEGKQFLLSLHDIASDGSASSSATLLWNSGGLAIPNLKDYGLQSKGLLDDFDAEGMTDAIVSYMAGVSNPASAAGSCRKYKAADADPVTWSMATLAHLFLIYKYRKEINEFFALYIPTAFPVRASTYWSATEYGGYYAWYISMLTGGLAHANSKYNYNYAVRAVSAI